MAEPICQAIYEQSTAGSGYDYAKTQYEVQLGFFSIDEIDIPYWYPCGDWWSAGLDKWCQGEDHTGLYTIMYDNGHFIPMSGVNPSSEALEIDNRQEGWPQSWQFFGSETAKIAGLIPIFDHAATLNVPGAAGNATIILGYNRSTVTHGGACPAGQTLATSGSSRGSCVPNFRYIAPVNLSFPLQLIGGH
jgi:hypothetical protein